MNISIAEDFIRGSYEVCISVRFADRANAEAYAKAFKEKHEKLMIWGGEKPEPRWSEESLNKQYAKTYGEWPKKETTTGEEK